MLPSLAFKYSEVYESSNTETANDRPMSELTVPVAWALEND